MGDPDLVSGDAVAATIAVGGATIWTGPESPVSLLFALAGAALVVFAKRKAARERVPAIEASEA